MVKKNIFIIICIAFSLVLLEIGFYFLSLFIPTEYYYKPPTRQEFERYIAANLDKLTGWLPNPGDVSSGGYRKSPHGQHFHRACISLYGDSFTFGSSVSHAEAWPNILSRLKKCRVDNYGVSGYGTDQAYLRFLYNKNDEAPTVILLHASEDILRNINQNMGLIYQSGRTISLKPRFILDGEGNLTLIPTPHLKIEDYQAFVDDMGQFLTTHEYLLPNSNYLSKRTLGFPYSFRVPYIFTYKRIYLGLTSLWFPVSPWYTELYDPEHPSGALQLTGEIMKNFVEEARRRGKVPLLFIIPQIRDFKYYKAKGTWVYEPLIEYLEKKQILVYNLGPLLLKKTVTNDLCDYFCTQKRTKSGHYTPEGNRILAEVVNEILNNPSGRTADR